MDALALAALGYPVFPCQPGDKAPHRYLAPNGFKNATREPWLIRSWWEHAPNAPIGLAPPKEVLVLDIDSRDASKEFLNDFEEFLDFPQARSGGGGLHIYCRVEREVKNRGRALPGYLLDLKGCGKGYVLAPPSPHPSGNSYQWEVDLVAVQDLPLLPGRFWRILLPQLNSAAIYKDKKPDYEISRKGQGQAGKAIPTAKQTRAAREELGRRAARLFGATIGERHSMLRNTAWALSRWLICGALTEQEIYKNLAGAASVVGLPPREIDDLILSALERGPAYFANSSKQSEQKE